MSAAFTCSQFEGSKPQQRSRSPVVLGRACRLTAKPLNTSVRAPWRAQHFKNSRYSLGQVIASISCLSKKQGSRNPLGFGLQCPLMNGVASGSDGKHFKVLAVESRTVHLCNNTLKCDKGRTSFAGVPRRYSAYPCRQQSASTPHAPKALCACHR